MIECRRFNWTVSYRGETEFSARDGAGRSLTLALRWRVPEREDGQRMTAEEHEREVAGAFGIVRNYRDSRQPIEPELFEQFCAWYAADGTYPQIELSRGYYRAGAGWIRV